MLNTHLPLWPLSAVAVCQQNGNRINNIERGGDVPSDFIPL